MADEGKKEATGVATTRRGVEKMQVPTRPRGGGQREGEEKATQLKQICLGVG
jgi:hypothetical protein